MGFPKTTIGFGEVAGTTVYLQTAVRESIPHGVAEGASRVTGESLRQKGPGERLILKSVVGIG